LFDWAELANFHWFMIGLTLLPENTITSTLSHRTKSSNSCHGDISS